MPTRNELTQLQSLPLELKVMRTQQRIREWGAILRRRRRLRFVFGWQG